MSETVTTMRLQKKGAGFLSGFCRRGTCPSGFAITRTGFG